MSFVTKVQYMWKTRKQIEDDKMRDKYTTHAFWITDEMSYAENLPGKKRQIARCSNCDSPSERPLGRYCRWCGARMDQDNPYNHNILENYLHNMKSPDQYKEQL